jgi:hypothetical protein
MPGFLATVELHWVPRRFLGLRRTFVQALFEGVGTAEALKRIAGLQGVFGVGIVADPVVAVEPVRVFLSLRLLRRGMAR